MGARPDSAARKGRGGHSRYLNVSDIPGDIETLLRANPLTANIAGMWKPTGTGILPRDYTYVTSWSPDDGAYVSKAIDFPNLGGHGDTPHEAIHEAMAAVLESLHALAHDKETPPKPLAIVGYDLRKTLADEMVPLRTMGDELREDERLRLRNLYAVVGDTLSRFGLADSNVLALRNAYNAVLSPHGVSAHVESFDSTAQALDKQLANAKAAGREQMRRAVLNEVDTIEGEIRTNESLNVSASRIAILPETMRKRVKAIP